MLKSRDDTSALGSDQRETGGFSRQNLYSRIFSLFLVDKFVQSLADFQALFEMYIYKTKNKKRKHTFILVREEFKEHNL